MLLPGALQMCAHMHVLGVHGLLTTKVHGRQRIENAGSPSLCVYGKCLESLQSRNTLRWAITGATVGSKVLPNDHSLNYVGSHIL